MIELVDAAIGAGALGVVAVVAVVRRALKAKRDERAQLIAMGEGMGIEYVPGEDIDSYRRLVQAGRHDRIVSAERKRERDAKGRFV